MRATLSWTTGRATRRGRGGQTGIGSLRCPPWRESYVKHKDKEGKAIPEVPQTSTSILIGATFSSARFNALETLDGICWRFSYYRASALAAQFLSHELIEFTGLEAFKGLRGEIRLSAEARQAWNALQRKNRRQIEEERGSDAANETYGSVLASSPDKIPKLAMVFKVARAGSRTRQGTGRSSRRTPWISRSGTRLTASRRTKTST